MPGAGPFTKEKEVKSLPTFHIYKNVSCCLREKGETQNKLAALLLNFFLSQSVGCETSTNDWKQPKWASQHDYGGSGTLKSVASTTTGSNDPFFLNF